jgi:plasmid maintenance system antidote protein VapI
VSVGELLEALLESTRSRVRNGQLTERGLARRIGISQAHMHNVLKGARLLTPEIADRLLQAFDLKVQDLLSGETHEGLLAMRDSSRKTGE